MDTEQLIYGSALMSGIMGSVLMMCYFVSRSLPSNVYVPKWVCIWVLFSSIIVTWDVGFVLNRPHSIKNPIWSASYSIYTSVDTLYSDEQDEFLYSVALINILEVALSIISLLIFCSRNFKAAAILIIVVSTMTCSKTLLYFMMEAVGGFKHTRQNDYVTLFTFYLVPNGIWILLPLKVICSISGTLVRDGLKME